VLVVPDKFSPEKRSEIMSRIRGKDTAIEVKVRSYLFSMGLRFRKNDRRYPGTPDVVLPKYRTVIFINGCFWHGHENCKLFRMPKSNVDFWRNKILTNKANDEKNQLLLEEMGFQVITIWECELKSDFEQTMEETVRKIKSGDDSAIISQIAYIRVTREWESSGTDFCNLE